MCRSSTKTLPASLATYGVDGRRLRIHLFDTSEAPPELMIHTCTGPCVVQQQARNDLAVQPAPTPVSRPPIGTISTAAVRSAYATAALETGMANMRIGLVDSRRHNTVAYYGVPANPPQPQVPVQMPALYATPSNPNYVSNTAGLPVNRSEGVVPTEYRGIFVGGLDYSARSKDITSCFKHAGNIVKCDLQKDATTGKFKGNAIIQYTTAKEARTAVKMFNEQKFMGMRIKVRLDKDSVPVTTSPTSSTSSGSSSGSAAPSYEMQQSRSNAQPIIVNGSVSQR